MATCRICGKEWHGAVACPTIHTKILKDHGVKSYKSHITASKAIGKSLGLKTVKGKIVDDAGHQVANSWDEVYGLLFDLGIVAWKYKVGWYALEDARKEDDSRWL
jgi:hypothetical protein